MNQDHATRLVELLPIWVAATSDSAPRCPSNRWLAENLALFSRSLPSKHSPADYNDVQALLLTLSGLAAQLLAEGVTDSDVLAQAERAYAITAGLGTEDIFCELPELLCSFSFAAWRASIELGYSRQAYKWSKLFDAAFDRSTEMRDASARVVGSLAGHTFAAVCRGYTYDSPAILGACTILTSRIDIAPSDVAACAEVLHKGLETGIGKSWGGIPRNYFLCRSALLVATAERHLGNLESALRWLELAQSYLERARNPLELTGRIAYTRVAAAYEQGKTTWVLAQLPQLIRVYELIGAESEIRKCWVIQAATLKLCGRIDDAIRICEQLASDEDLDPEVLPFSLATWADLKAIRGEYEEAAAMIGRARSLVETLRLPTVDIHLRISLGQILRQSGRLEPAILTLTDAIQTSEDLRIVGLSARARLVLAETYLAAGRLEDAEREGKAALIVFRREGMVLEIGPLTALLDECARRAKRQIRRA